MRPLFCALSAIATLALTASASAQDTAEEIRRRLREWERIEGNGEGQILETLTIQVGGQTLRIEVKLVGGAGTPPDGGDFPARLESAYENDTVPTGTTKEGQRKALADAYRRVAAAVKRPELKTVEHVFFELGKELRTNVDPRSLPRTQAVIREHVTRAPPARDPTASLDKDDLRARFEKLLTEVADALDRLK